MSDETIQNAIKTATDELAAVLPSVTTIETEARSLLARAQEAIEDVVESTVEAVKENPLTAAAIAGGVVVAAAGAAYGVSKLLEDDDKPGTANR